MDKDFVRVDEWIETEENRYIYPDGKLIIIPFDKIFNRDVSAVNTFVIKKESYVNKLSDTKDGRGICPYINYFITFYDKEKELLLSYFKLKSIIDNKDKKIKSPEAFIQAIHTILLTDTLKEKISQMVEDNYYINLAADKYVEQLKFTEDHAKILMKISVTIKIMVPILFHYISSYNMKKKVHLYNFYEGLFSIYAKDVDIYMKLWLTVSAKVKSNISKNFGSWDQREIMGIDPATFTDELLKDKIITETIFKYHFDKNIISFNSVVIEKQLGYFLRDKFNYTMYELSTEKDSEGLSGVDKLEMNSYKIDESMIILSDINIEDTIKRIRKSMNISIPKDEVQFYQNNYKIDKFQVQLVNYHYARYFGGYKDLNILTRKQYLKLIILLKRRLQLQGFVYLPQVITGNIEKLNKRTIRNAKFLTKIENSSVYQTLVQEKFSTLNELNKNNMILNLLSTILNTSFTVVDYDMPDRLGEPLEVANPDILSDEFLNFLNQI